MIIRKSFTKKWIIKKYKELNADPILIEKAIFACELLGLLVENQISFVFKGGTALLLLIPKVKRLSIDIDILTQEELQRLEQVFGIIIEKGIFQRWDEDERKTKRNLPKKHFRFYYNSFYQDDESYILLDILFTKSPYLETRSMAINLPLFEIEKEVKVVVPTLDSIAGDKLTAFAPNTIGIPYGNDKSMEIIKQLFDLGILFEYLSNIQEVKESYRNVAKVESSFRNIKANDIKFLDDTINTSFLLCQMDYSDAVKNNETKELKDGIKRIKSHIIGGKYSHLDAKIDAAKVAFLAYILKTNKTKINFNEIQRRRTNYEMVKDIKLDKKFNVLNKLKTISPASLYLWGIVSGKIQT